VAAEVRPGSGRARSHTLSEDEEAKMTKELKKGDQVEWDTSQGKTHGRVEKKQTSKTHIKGHKVAASKDNPQFIVRSEKSGKKAAHKPEELRKKP
jgi:hypothetical protein